MYAVGTLAKTVIDFFCWHAIQLVLLPPRSHWGGRGWYTAVTLFYYQCLWQFLLYFNGELWGQIIFSTSTIRHEHPSVSKSYAINRVYGALLHNSVQRFVFQVVWNFVREESFKSETLASGSSTDKFIARHPVVLGQVGFGTPRFGEVNATLIIKAASLADTKASDFKLMFDPAYLDLRITL